MKTHSFTQEDRISSIETKIGMMIDDGTIKEIISLSITSMGTNNDRFAAILIYK